MKQQTAVEWLISNLINPNRSISDLEIIKQATIMEKEQIESAYIEGAKNMRDRKYIVMYEYYDKTYNE